MRQIETINGDWLYKGDFRDSYRDPRFSPDKGWTPVCLPHTNQELPYNCFDERDSQFVSTYRKTLRIPPADEGRRFLLEFDGVMTAADVWIDGTPAGSHSGGYTPFSLDITALVVPGRLSVITVKVDSSEREDIPPFGKVLDFLTYGGIYRDVRLLTVPAVYVDNLFARPGSILEERKTVTGRIFFKNTRDMTVSREAALLLKDKTGRALGEHRMLITVPPGESCREMELTDLEDAALWSPEDPVLHTLEVSLRDAGEEERDVLSVRFGFRTARFRPDGFYLNGKKVKIRGLNRHQSYPYVGYAMPQREQRREADRLREGLGVNMVRTSHYPQSPSFLDRCDEIGLLVFEEIPGWQHIGGIPWKERACRHVEEMIRRDWNHPSIVLWGVRINESGDDGEFYRETNRIARELDDTRQTGGVRYIERSELLEDVYTMNDFIHSGGKEILRKPGKITGKRVCPT